MECFERGLLSLKDTDGIELCFGNSEGLIQVLLKIANRDGLGNILAEGSERAARIIGKGSDALVVAVKGQELPAHMPQHKRSLALIYAVNPFGADHQSHEHDPGYTPESSPTSLGRMALLGLTDPQPEQVLNREKVRMALLTQWNYSFMDSACLCQFVFGPAWELYGPLEMVALMNAITGWEMTIEDIQRIGERRLNMMRAFNAREGVGRDRDTLPNRLYDEPLKGGVTDGVKITRQEVQAALDAYYELCGWDKQTGMPTLSRLEELGLGWVA